MTRILISLIGHQPLPTLLALRHLRPDKVVLLGTNDHRINAIRNNLAEIAAQIFARSEEPNQPERQIEVIPSTAVDPWNITGVDKRLSQVLRREQNATLICDVTGGTKAMSIGLTQFARRRNAEVVYMDSDTIDTRMWRYYFNDGNLHLKDDSPKSLPTLMNIQDLFHLYLGNRILRYRPNNNSDNGPWFERDVKRGFQSLVDCLEQSVIVSGHEEADLVLRIKNRFAIVECKAIKRFNMTGVKQLNNMASERYLGLYTGKILAVCVEEGDSIHEEHRAVSEQHKIKILELHGWQGSQEHEYEWGNNEKKAFQEAIDEVFSCA